MLQSHNDTASLTRGTVRRRHRTNKLVIILINLLPFAIWMACQTKGYNHTPLINPWHHEEDHMEHKQPCNYLDKSASFCNLDGMPNEMLQSHTTDQPMSP